MSGKRMDVVFCRFVIVADVKYISCRLDEEGLLLFSLFLLLLRKSRLKMLKDLMLSLLLLLLL